MSDKPVFNVNRKLFNQLTDWEHKMAEKEKLASEIEANDKAKETSKTQKEKLE